MNDDYTKDYKVVIWYAEDGEVVNDFNYAEKFDEFLKLYEEVKDTDETLELRYCTDLGVFMSRIAILRGIIPCSEIVYRFENYALFPDKYARIDHWPEGFCFTTMDKILTELCFWLADSNKKKENLKET